MNATKWTRAQIKVLLANKDNIANAAKALRRSEAACRGKLNRIRRENGGLGVLPSKVGAPPPKRRRVTVEMDPIHDHVLAGYMYKKGIRSAPEALRVALAFAAEHDQ